MPWNTGTGPRYAPPPTMAGVVAQGMGMMGDRLKVFADQKRERERIAGLDAREVQWRTEDLARGDEDAMFRLQAEYGFTPDTPSLGTQLGKAAQGPQQFASNGPLPLGTALGASVTPPAPANAPTVSFRGRTGTLDPSRSVEGMRAAATREQQEADIQKLVGVLTPAFTQTYGERGASMAEAAARGGFKPGDFAYQPLSRDEQFGDFREEQTIQTDANIRQSNAVNAANRTATASASRPSNPADAATRFYEEAVRLRNTGMSESDVVNTLARDDQPYKAILPRDQRMTIARQAFSDVAVERGGSSAPNANSRARAEALESMRALAANPTPAGDLAFSTLFMKITDPGSVVRDTEIRMLGEAGSLADKWGARRERAETGRLTDARRAELLQQAEAIVNGDSGAAAGPTRTNALRERAAALKAEGKSEQEARAILQREGLL